MDPAPAATAPTKSKRQQKRDMRDAIAIAAAPQTGARRSRVAVRKVDLWTVLKVSLCFYLAALVVVLAAGIVLWLVVDAAGGIHNFENFMGDILSAKDYHLVPGEILVGSALVGVVLAALLTIVTVVAAALYNLFSELVGGVEVTLVETTG
jgi:hypothetical protein